MSIAVAALVKPSRTARCLLLAWALAQCGAAGVVALAMPARFANAASLAALLAGAGVLLAGAAMRRPKTHRIDISGTGELRVTVQQDVRTPHPIAPVDDGALLVLLPGSVRWPGLMMLRLGTADVAPPPARRMCWVVPVWRDSVDGEAWRALSVALAVIGRPGASRREVEDNR